MGLDFLPHIDSARCIGCELCVKLCPTQTLALVNDIASIASPAACNYNGICQEICPTRAISLPYEIVLFRRSSRKPGRTGEQHAHSGHNHG